MTALNKLSRRSVIIGALAALSASPAFALTTGQAKELVGKLVGDINAAINSNQSEARMIKDFEAILVRYGDMPIIAQTVLGAPWRSASASERKAFTSALQGYLSRKYGKRFREFVGGEIEVTTARKVRSFFEVKTVAKLQGSQPFDVIFLVSNRSGADKFFNMVIAGINLRTTENTEIGALLDKNRGNITRMTAELATRG